MTSPVLIGACVEIDRALLYYAPYWFEGQGGILEQEVCSTTPIKSYRIFYCSKPPTNAI